MMATDLAGARIHITGIVQGVGFRPFVYSLAQRHGLTGQVCNTSAGVDVEVDGSPQALQAFIQALQDEAPPLARIHSLESTLVPASGFMRFEILESQPIPGAFQPISPDVSLCPDCLAEILNPSDRRYLYPFTNCTNCGPRFTIIRDIPYDRPLTSMAGFPMCPACTAEYQDPADRRFHAQPIACPVCGPRLWLELPGQPALDGPEALLAARRLLLEGRILAIKGLGGFHLACNALDPAAVDELRRRKLRVGKPFALMVASLETARRYCAVSPAEAALLASPQSPVVLLERLPGSPVVPGVAPGQRSLGLMLPYTPLHALLFADLGPSSPPPEVLVMTSGNLSEEPIVTDNDEARLRLASLADAFLLHDRPIHIRCDDSVVRLVEFDGGAPAELLIRRSRGYAPFPVRLPFDVPPLLAAGAELKNTFCLGRGQYAFLSHHIGDLENYETLQSFEQGIAHFERLFRIQPQAIACDLHPGYLATTFAQELACRENLPLTGVQHHHAHIAACMAENGLPLDAQVIGLSFDGTGYGTDGAVWGGEFLLAGYAAFERRYHFAYLPLPGGDRAIREPWRMALAWLTTANLEWQPGLPPVDYALGLEGGAVRLEALRRQLETGLNSPPTSSLGRLFDAAAALLGVRQVASYEAQAAIELEALADPAETGRYPAFELDQTLLPSAPVPPGQPAGPLPIGTSALLAALLADLRLGAPLPIISARFHNSLAHLALQVCRQLRQETGRQQVALSGGVWQNTFLLQRAVRLLTQDGFTPRVHRQVPPNDGGLSLGQLAIAAARLADPTPQA